MEHETKDKTVAKRRLKERKEETTNEKEKRDCNHVDVGLFSRGNRREGAKDKRVETFSIL